MTKLSKFITFWICLAFILFIVIDDVYAESCNYIQPDQFANSTSTFTANIGNTKNLVSYDTPLNIQGKNTLKFKVYYTILNTNDTYISNVDWTSTCQNVTDYTTTYGQSYTITYADGSTATISGRNQEIDYVCSNLRTQGAITNIINYEPQVTGLHVELAQNASKTSFIVCDNDTNGNVTCPISTNQNIYGIRYTIILSKYNSANVRVGLISRVGTTCINDTQEIINNNNTNTQNIINNQNQNSDREYNFISSSTIDSNTTSDVNNIDVSNSDTKLAVTNFALIPLNFMQSIINSFSSSCSQVCIGNCGSGHDNDWRFVFPCLDLENLVGSTVYSVIDSLFAFGMVFAFIRSVRKFFINALLLTADASSEVGVFL